MLIPLFEGVICGLTIAFMFGSALFMLLQTSLSQGFGSGVKLAIGISLSDATLVALSILGFASFLDRPNIQFWFGIVAGIVLILYGIHTYRKKNFEAADQNKIAQRQQTVQKFIEKEQQHKIHLPHTFTFILKGFGLNIANPLIWAFWMVVITTVTARMNNLQEVISFFIGMLGTALCLDIAKCFLAHKLKNILSSQLISVINKIVGILLIVFGFIMFIRLLREYFQLF